jgi:hypothetical protein
MQALTWAPRPGKKAPAAKGAKGAPHAAPAAAAAVTKAGGQGAKQAEPAVGAAASDAARPPVKAEAAGGAPGPAPAAETGRAPPKAEAAEGSPGHASAAEAQRTPLKADADGAAPGPAAAAADEAPPPAVKAEAQAPGPAASAAAAATQHGLERRKGAEGTTAADGRAVEREAGDGGVRQRAPKDRTMLPRRHAAINLPVGHLDGNPVYCLHVGNARPERLLRDVTQLAGMVEEQGREARFLYECSSTLPWQEPGGPGGGSAPDEAPTGELQRNGAAVPKLARPHRPHGNYCCMVRMLFMLDTSFFCRRDCSHKYLCAKLSEQC